MQSFGSTVGKAIALCAIGFACQFSNPTAVRASAAPVATASPTQDAELGAADWKEISSPSGFDDAIDDVLGAPLPGDCQSRYDCDQIEARTCEGVRDRAYCENLNGYLLSICQLRNEHHGWRRQAMLDYLTCMAMHGSSPVNSLGCLVAYVAECARADRWLENRLREAREEYEAANADIQWWYGECILNGTLPFRPKTDVEPFPQNP